MSSRSKQDSNMNAFQPTHKKLHVPAQLHTNTDLWSDIATITRGAPLPGQASVALGARRSLRALRPRGSSRPVCTHLPASHATTYARARRHEPPWLPWPA